MMNRRSPQPQSQTVVAGLPQREGLFAFAPYWAGAFSFYGYFYFGNARGTRVLSAD